ncbi:MAG: TonB family protein [Bacteroidia bacterium]|nr:TonB family protein [Bacteroidia bacterium]
METIRFFWMSFLMFIMAVTMAFAPVKSIKTEPDCRTGAIINPKKYAPVNKTPLTDKKDDDKTLSPYFFVKSDDAGLDQLPLKETKVDVNIAGVIADVKVTQVYENKGKKPIEAIYIFPASTRAAVYAMKMHVGNRILTAKIQEKEKARQDYEKAKSEGKSASLLEQQRPNVFQMNVANIMPGDTIKVVMQYTELLVPEDGVYEFIYPTVVGPRYSNTPDATATASEKWVSNPYTHAGEAPLYTFEMTGKLLAGMPVKDIRCPSHDLQISYEGKNIASLKLNDSEKYGGNRDLILQYKLADDAIVSGLLLYKGENSEENFFLAMIQPPNRPDISMVPPRDFVFIVDVSGSMYGYPLDVSKKLMKNLIGKLRPIDKFNIMTFAGGNNVFSEKSVPATKENLNKALDMMDKQQGGGGTELIPALKRALSLEKPEGCSRTFVIATDGYVSVEKEAFELIRKNLNNANFFAFGIGTAVNRYIIEGIAHVGMGEPFIVTEPNEAGKKADKFREYIQTPVLTDVKADYGGFNVYEVEPLTIPDVLAKRPIILYGKWKGEPSGVIKITGKSGKEKYSCSFDASKIAPLKENHALEYLWARQKIRMIDDFNNFAPNSDSQKEITNLGLKYNLLTNYTSFIAIDSIARNKDGKSVTVNQPLPMPDKVSDYAVGGYANPCMGATRNMSSGAYGQGGGLTESSKDKKKQSYKACKEKGSTVDGLSANETLVLPEFSGGEKALEKFIKDNLVYPPAAKNAGIHGTVTVSFTVEADGNLSDIKVNKGIGKGCDEEALRIVKLMAKKWKPGKKNGKKTAMQHTIQIKF